MRTSNLNQLLNEGWVGFGNEFPELNPLLIKELQKFCFELMTEQLRFAMIQEAKYFYLKCFNMGVIKEDYEIDVVFSESHEVVVLVRKRSWKKNY